MLVGMLSIFSNSSTWPPLLDQSLMLLTKGLKLSEVCNFNLLQHGSLLITIQQSVNKCMSIPKDVLRILPWAW